MRRNYYEETDKKNYVMDLFDADVNKHGDSSYG